MRSKTWQRGRKLKAVSLVPRPTKSLMEDWTFDTRLSWVSITPLGSPVVPEV
jgi:hypothetical protein